jgi:hypothetical protein
MRFDCHGKVSRQSRQTFKDCRITEDNLKLNHNEAMGLSSEQNDFFFINNSKNNLFRILFKMTKINYFLAKSSSVKN